MMKRNSRSVSVFLVLAALGFGRISHADLIVNNGKLDLGGTLTVTGDYIQNGGILLMDNSSSVLDISGDFTVNTNAVNTTLSDGRIQIEGNFTQSGVSTDDFRASGNHTVELDGTADQSIAFGSAGIGSNNHFGHLEIDKASGKVSVTTDLAVVSNGLIFDTATIMEIAANKVSTVGGLVVDLTSGTATITSPNPGTDRFDFMVTGAIDVDGLNFGSAKVNGLDVSATSSFTQFDNVTFTDALPGGRHIRIQQAGPVTITFNGVSLDNSFLPAGRNITLDDTDGGGDVVLNVVGILGNGAGPTHEEEVNSAAIVWVNIAPVLANLEVADLT